MTDRALVGASVEATVGTVAHGSPAWWPTALAASRVLPPPTPTTTSALAFLAASVIRSISRCEHSPPKTSLIRCTSPRCSDSSTVVPASPQTFWSAMTKASLPRSLTCSPRDPRTPRPWMYLRGPISACAATSAIPVPSSGSLRRGHHAPARLTRAGSRQLPTFPPWVGLPRPDRGRRAGNSLKMPLSGRTVVSAVAASPADREGAWRPGRRSRTMITPRPDGNSGYQASTQAPSWRQGQAPPAGGG
jgi:hypothetical protein